MATNFKGVAIWVPTPVYEKKKPAREQTGKKNMLFFFPPSPPDHQQRKGGGRREEEEQVNEKYSNQALLTARMKSLKARW